MQKTANCVINVKRVTYTCNICLSIAIAQSHYPEPLPRVIALSHCPEALP